MRIVIDARLRESVITGAGRYLEGLVPAIAELAENDEFIILSCDSSKTLWKNLPANVNVKPAQISPAGFKQQIFYGSILKYLHADMLYYPMFDLPISVNIPCAIMIYDLNAMLLPDYFTNGKIWRRPASRLLHYHAVYRAGRVLTSSNATALEINRIFPFAKEKTVPIHNGYSRAFKNNIKTDFKDIKNRWGISEEYMLYVGVHRPHKNLEGLIRAIPSIRKSRGNIQLICAGTIDKRFPGPVDLVLKLDLGNAVKFTGYIPDDELEALYQNADAFIFPSFQEGFGVPLLEAMDYGVPIACSDIPVHREIAGEAAIYFNPRSHEIISEVILNLIQNVQLKNNLIAKGKERLSKFKWDECARNTYEVFRDMLPQK